MVREPRSHLTGALLDTSLLRWLYGAVLILLVANVCLIPVGSLSALPRILAKIIRQLDMAREANLATWLSSAMLLFNALYAYRLARCSASNERRLAGTYWLLAAGFLLLSVDDLTQIHEQVERFIKQVVGTGEGAWPHLGVLFALILAAGLMILVAGPWLSSLRKGGGSLLAGVVAALLTCSLAEFVYNLVGSEDRDWIFRVEVVFEEGGELLAILLFLTLQHRQLCTGRIWADSGPE